MKKFILIIMLIFLVIPLISSADHVQQVDWLYKNGEYFYFKFGKNTNLSANTIAVVSDHNGSQEYADSTGVTTIFSSSSLDSIGVGGCQTLLIEGILGPPNYQIAQELVTMVGTDTVTAKHEFLWVHRMAVFTSGDSYANVGDISCEITTKNVSKILAGVNQTNSAIFYMPGMDFVGNSYTPGSLYHWFAYILRAQSTGADFSLWKSRAGSTVWSNADQRGGVSTGSTGSEFSRPMEVLAGTGLRVMVTSTSGAAEATGGFCISFGTK